jgi:hypothetical protein
MHLENFTKYLHTKGNLHEKATKTYYMSHTVEYNLTYYSLWRLQVHSTQEVLAL